MHALVDDDGPPPERRVCRFYAGGLYDGRRGRATGADAEPVPESRGRSTALLGRPVLLDFSPSDFIKNEERLRLERLKNEFYLSQGKYPSSLSELNADSSNYEIKVIGESSFIYPK